jgi:V8-like Glu-specific endopeptidase
VLSNVTQGHFYLIASLLTGSVSSCIAGDKPIYGHDDRVEVYQSNSIMCNVASSVAAMYHIDDITRLNQNQWRLDAGPTLEEKNWCNSERFISQNSGALCTAFLIGDNIAVTAGHCINDVADTHGSGLNCRDAIFVFDHRLNQYDRLPRYLNAQQIFRCNVVVNGTTSMTSVDWRVIELDRITNRHPLPVYTGNASPSATDSLDIVGHPLGLPMKVARNGELVSASGAAFFLASVDSYEGNSGSPVLAMVNGQLAVVGVLSSGETDIAQDSDSNCTYSRRCSDAGCTGERVTRANTFSPWATVVHDSPAANWLYTSNEACH